MKEELIERLGVHDDTIICQQVPLRLPIGEKLSHP